ncbi:hypothetical protein TNCV_3170141 [Trichonephila clavipes]|nr:hypothetical protein TNCV_3170141 [Trichonephila clavipes]
MEPISENLSRKCGASSQTKLLLKKSDIELRCVRAVSVKYRASLNVVARRRSSLGLRPVFSVSKKGFLFLELTFYETPVSSYFILCLDSF